MIDRKVLGMAGEKLAAVYLKLNGHKIMARNFRKPWGEIDLISTSPDGTLVFTEIKSTLIEEADKAPSPSDHMNFKKIRNLRRSAEFFSNKFPELSRHGWRIDFISIRIPEEIVGKGNLYPPLLLTRLLKCCEVELWENAV
jgi:putative endonuclease